jgi:acyl carrier protein
MATIQTDATFSIDEILAKVIAVLEDMTQDWDLELPNGINGDTRLMVDLSFESIDVVQFVVSLEQSFSRKGLPFEKLFMRDGDYVDDLQVSEVVAFLEAQL